MKVEWTRGYAVAVAAAALLLAQPAFGLTKCSMKFSLKGWSAFYQTASGYGTITCDGGQSTAVTLQSKGGGLTFGKSKIVNGTGEFSPVESMHELFGNYAKAEAHAGMGDSSTAQVLTKGEVSLALSGTGQGVNLGFDFGRFTISPAKDSPRKK